MLIIKNTTSNSQKHIKRINASINHLTDILNDFLSLDKLENGEIKVKNDKVNVKKIITEIIREAELTLKKGQTIEFTFEGKTEFKTDSKILYIILLNLLSNAIKYSAEGSKIECKAGIAKNKLHFKIKDSGIGIPLNEQEKIFNRLFRAKNAEMIEGTGLGLNILKKHVELLNGSVSFLSKENVGSTFMVEIPN
jgi:signal transduction histidine kinase